jgi:rhodanese-related sulfurtransferase
MNGRSNRIAVLSGWMIFAVAAATIPAATAAAAGAATASPSSQAANAQVPAEKQTTLGLYVTARESYDQWKAAPDKVIILDVRTIEEYMWVGHTSMAWLVPVVAVDYTWDAAKKLFPLKPLPDFVARVQKVAKPDDTLMVMCRSGGRGAMAVNMLAKAGFKNVYNITDGMEGDTVKDPESVFRGQRLVNGWKNAGLPWTYEIDPARLVLPATP